MYIVLELRTFVLKSLTQVRTSEFSLCSSTIKHLNQANILSYQAPSANS